MTDDTPAKPPREFLILYRESNRMFNSYRIDDSQLANEHLNDQTYRNAGIPQREAIHVIEKSYADRLEQRVAELTEAIVFSLRGLQMWRKYQSPGNIAEVEQRLRQALKRDGGR